MLIIHFQIHFFIFICIHHNVVYRWRSCEISVEWLLHIWNIYVMGKELRILREIDWHILEVLWLLVETTTTETLVHIKKIIVTLMGELCHQLLVGYHHICVLISYLWHSSYQRWFLEMLVVHKHLLLVLLVLIKHCLVLVYLRAPVVLYLLNSLIISTNHTKLHWMMLHVKWKETSWTLI